MNSAQQLIQQDVPVSRACAALGLSRSTFYRQHRPIAPAPPAHPRPRPARALTPLEQTQVCELLNSQRFADCSPRQVYAALLDEGQYLCSVSTMYRLLRQHDQVRERRDQLRHPAYTKPELLATGSNQLWSWDITKLRTPVKWHYFYLYVVLDVFSRYVVGWMVAEQQAAELAEQLVGNSCIRQGIEPEQLTIHADRGGPMIAHSLAQLCISLGVSQSFARPHTPNDNPFSEAHFKTLKYRPDFPGVFGSLQDARAWAQQFFAWYNHTHRHISLGLLTPAAVHLGQAEQMRAQRQLVLRAAYEAHPERFVKGLPTPPSLPQAVWLNPPAGVGSEPP